MVVDGSHKSFAKLLSYAKSCAKFSNILRSLDLRDVHLIRGALTNSQKAIDAVHRLIAYAHIPPKKN